MWLILLNEVYNKNTWKFIKDKKSSEVGKLSTSCSSDGNNAQLVACKTWKQKTVGLWSNQALIKIGVEVTGAPTWVEKLFGPVIHVSISHYLTKNLL